MPFILTGVLSSKGLNTQGTNQGGIVVKPFTSAIKRVTRGNTLRSMNVQVANHAISRPRSTISLSVPPLCPEGVANHFALAAAP
ncbi:MAG: hypothetical protein ABIR71_08490 [Chthoniobacterales bacterium]